MHHSLRFYSGHRKGIIRLYMFGARFTRIPLIGRLVRWLANAYGRNMEGGYLLTTSEAEAVVDLAEGVAVGLCTCREVYKNCDNPVDAEILLGPTRGIFMKAMPHDSHEITREEAKEVLRDCHRRGLIHAIIKCHDDYYAICNCCPCCCVPLRLSNQYGIGDALVRHKDIVQEFREHQLSHRD
ncbi:ferredoxin-like protein [Chloroflexota bacterium]